MANVKVVGTVVSLALLAVRQVGAEEAQPRGVGPDIVALLQGHAERVLGGIGHYVVGVGRIVGIGVVALPHWVFGAQLGAVLRQGIVAVQRHVERVVGFGRGGRVALVQCERVGHIAWCAAFGALAAKVDDFARGCLCGGVGSHALLEQGALLRDVVGLYKLEAELAAGGRAVGIGNGIFVVDGAVGRRLKIGRIGHKINAGGQAIEVDGLAAGGGKGVVGRAGMGAARAHYYLRVGGRCHDKVRLAFGPGCALIGIDVVGPGCAIVYLCAHLGQSVAIERGIVGIGHHQHVVCAILHVGRQQPAAGGVGGDGAAGRGGKRLHVPAKGSHGHLVGIGRIDAALSPLEEYDGDLADAVFAWQPLFGSSGALLAS